MIVSSSRPYFCPYPGYFKRIIASDVFVILDSVQYPLRSTWITRNRFKNDQGTLWLGIPVWKKGLGLQRISEVRICREGRWQRKHLESITQAYQHAPYLDEHFAFFEGLFSPDIESILEMNLKAISYIRDVLRVETKVMLLSELGIDEKGSALPVEICRAVGGTHYLARTPTCKRLEEDLFREAAIELEYLNTPTLVYPQLWGEYIPNLSIFDLILNCGPKAREIMRRGEKGSENMTHHRRNKVHPA